MARQMELAVVRKSVDCPIMMTATYQNEIIPLVLYWCGSAPLWACVSVCSLAHRDASQADVPAGQRRRTVSAMLC